MNPQQLSDRQQRLLWLRVWILVWALTLAGSSSAGPDQQKKPADAARSPTVGKCVSPSGALLCPEEVPIPQLVRPSLLGTQWRLCKRDEPVEDGQVLVAVGDAAIESNNGGVRLTLLPDLARLSSLPVLESAVLVHRNGERDLDFTLDCGRVEVTNQHKDNEPARVRIRFRKEIWDLILTTPETKVALIMYGRWPRGVPFANERTANEEPTADLVLFVLNGDVQLKKRGDQYALHAPPGPASFHWDSIAGADPGPQHQQQLPDWARTSSVTKAETAEAKAALGRLAKRFENQYYEKALLETLASPNASERRLAVYALGAVDDLPFLIDALSDPKHEDTRDAAIIALRHWIGRDPGQDSRLYAFLQKPFGAGKGYSANQAAIVLQLLHSFGDSDLARPATYETLLDYLLHDKVGIRQLAKWHLYRLVPAGKDIAYDPAGSSEQRQRAHDQWKKLIPNGKLPSR